MSSSAGKRPRTKPSQCRLEAPGWSELNRRSLKRLILQGANQGLPAVFDFDNTLVCGDIGEATLAVLARWAVLTPRSVAEGLCPSFRAPDGKVMRIQKCSDVTQYYESLLKPTAHGSVDSQPLANGYVWATQVLQGLKLKEIVNATCAAFEWSDSFTPGMIEVTPGRSAYPVPFFYPEMIELVRELLRHRYEVWIISASNVWSVRWLVLNVLNPLLRVGNLREGVRPDHVVGISTLLSDQHGRLYKDSVLVRQSRSYACFDNAVLNRFRISSQLHFPVPVYSGKVASLFHYLGRNPYLVVGDSPGDLPMMSIGRHRLWIARLNKPAYQKTARAWFKRTGGMWLIQPTLALAGQGFIS